MKMIVHQFANAVSDEITTPESAGLEQDHQHVFEFVSHPMHQRQGESLLLAIENLTRHPNALGEFAQDVLLLVTTQLPVNGKAGRVLDKFMVENWDAHF